MNSRSSPTIVLVSVPGTLGGIDSILRRAGVRLVRLMSSRPRPVDPTVWLKRLAGSPKPDTVLVTSRAAVAAGVRPWRRAGGPLPATLEFWAVGPGTAQALRRVGIRRVHRPRTVGILAIASSLRRMPTRRVVYFRSDVAGPQLARMLRSQGHRVVDLVVYRLETPPRLTDRARRGLSRAALLVVTSPSGLSNLRSRLGRTTFSRLSRTARLVVLGERSRRAARGHGFRHVSVAPSTTAQRFTRHLLRELRNARS
ncbi:MAG: uroporphyrinogen-III synthase [Thermoplasmata archaeon]